MDGILGVGPLELIIIVVLALVILGPERLPDTIRQVARFIRQARAIGNELTSQFSEELNLLDDFNPKKILEDVVGDDDDDFDAKSMLGIKKDDLKVGIDNKKASSKNTTKTPASSTKNATTKKTTKPALGDTDPEETTAVDAVTEKAPTDAANPEADANKAGTDIADTDKASTDKNKTKTAEQSDDEKKSIGGANQTSKSVSANGGAPKSTASRTKDQVESTAVESVTENTIAPPGMTSPQSAITEKSSPADTKPNNAENVLAETVAQEISADGIVENSSPADADKDAEATKDVGEV